MNNKEELLQNYILTSNYVQQRLIEAEDKGLNKGLRIGAGIVIAIWLVIKFWNAPLF